MVGLTKITFDRKIDRSLASKMRDRALVRHIDFVKAWRKHNKLCPDLFLLKELLQLSNQPCNVFSYFFNGEQSVAFLAFQLVLAFISISLSGIQSAKQTTFPLLLFLFLTNVTQVYNKNLFTSPLTERGGDSTRKVLLL